MGFYYLWFALIDVANIAKTYKNLKNIAEKSVANIVCRFCDVVCVTNGRFAGISGKFMNYKRQRRVFVTINGLYSGIFKLRMRLCK